MVIIRRSDKQNDEQHCSHLFVSCIHFTSPYHLYIVFLAIFLVSCTATPRHMELFASANDKSALIWPSLPEIPRYRFSGVLLGERNFVAENGHEESSLSSFFSWLVGLDNRSSLPVQLERPLSGMSNNGRIYVTDIGRHAIFVFDENQPGLQVWENADRNSHFVAPVGIILDKHSIIHVADAELGRIIRLDMNGNPLGSYAEDTVTRPTGLAYDQENDLVYVSDTAKHDIKVFSSYGNLLKTIGGPGTSEGSFNGPTHLFYTSGTLLVSDTLNARIQLVSELHDNNQIIGKRGLYVGDLSRPKGVAMDTDGNIYVVESYYDHLLIYNSKGQLLLPIGGTGAEKGKFFLPAGLWIDDKNRIFVADMYNSRVVIFQYLGE